MGNKKRGSARINAQDMVTAKSTYLEIEQDTTSQKTAATSNAEVTSSGSFPDFEDNSKQDQILTRLSSSGEEKNGKGKKKKATRTNDGKKLDQSKQVPEDWKRKVKTELCKFWLQGDRCENANKDQGCGFAHGVHELQKKKGLNKQYLTSVCKNFIEDPSKCSYGHRCIFQHPSAEISERQPYSVLMKDNVKYTAMRLFQEIEGADTLYINTYALNSHRLPIFKTICTLKDAPEPSSEGASGSQI